MLQSKTTARLLAALAGTITALALLAPSASAATPAPGYEKFAGCPSPAENPNVFACVRTTITGGHVEMGNKSVPLTKEMTLSGGADVTGKLVSNSKGGLSSVQQQIPGGVIGLTGLDWLVNFLDIDSLQLFAVTELAGQPLLTGSSAVTLPIKVRLVNPVLGKSCYVGSNANPIVLNLTTETTSPPPPNVPITGVQPEASFSESPPEILQFRNGVFVDNAFGAPGVNGCKLTLLGFIPFSLNDIVNFASGLPSPAGTNETAQNFDLDIVPQSVVYP